AEPVAHQGAEVMSDDSEVNGLAGRPRAYHGDHRAETSAEVGGKGRVALRTDVLSGPPVATWAMRTPWRWQPCPRRREYGIHRFLIACPALAGWIGVLGGRRGCRRGPSLTIGTRGAPAGWAGI